MSFMRLFILQLISSLFHAPSLNTVPGTPGTLASVGATALQRTLWSDRLAMDNTLDDIWEPSMEQVVDIQQDRITSMPENIFMKAPMQERGVFKMVLGMTTPWREAPREGSEEGVLGYEEDDLLYHMPVYVNDIKKGAKKLGHGLQYEMMNATGVYNFRDQKFRKYRKELRGRRIREASMLTVEGALTKAPHTNVVRQQFCSNIFIPNLPIGDMPTWDLTDLTVTAGSADALGWYPQKTFSGANSYVETIADKMLEASGTGASPLAYLNVDNLNDLDKFVRTRTKLTPIKIGKESGFMFVIPDEVAYYLTDPNRTGSLGAYFKDVHNLTSEELAYGGIIGKYKSLYFKVDTRGPTLSVNGSSGSYALTPGFVNPGNNDDRNLSPWSATSGSLNYVFDVGFVYGAGAMIESIMVPAQYGNKESTEYGEIVGEAMYEIGGIQTVRYDVDTPTDDTGTGKSLIQRGVVMVLMSRLNATTIRT